MSLVTGYREVQSLFIDPPDSYTDRWILVKKEASCLYSRIVQPLSHSKAGDYAL